MKKLGVLRSKLSWISILYHHTTLEFSTALNLIRKTKTNSCLLSFTMEASNLQKLMCPHSKFQCAMKETTVPILSTYKRSKEEVKSKMLIYFSDQKRQFFLLYTFNNNKNYLKRGANSSTFCFLYVLPKPAEAYQTAFIALKVYSRCDISVSSKLIFKFVSWGH